MTSTVPDWTVLDWPAVSAVVRADGTAEVTIGGASIPIAADNVADARDKVIAHIATHTAARLGRPVRAHTRDPDGTWWLLIHPDGTVDAIDPPAEPTQLAYPPLTPSASRRGRLTRLSRRRGTTPAVLAPPSIRRPLTSPRIIAVINPRGGTYTTTSVLQLAHVLASAHRTLAWDTTIGGSLAQRATQIPTTPTTTSDLQTDLASLDNAAQLHLDHYVHTQPAGYDVLPGPERPVDPRDIAPALRRYYDLILCDAAPDSVHLADQLVLTVTIREDSALAVSHLLDHLDQNHGDLVAGATTLVAAHSPQTPGPLHQQIHAHFRRRTHTVIDIPYEPALTGGGRYYPEDHSKATRHAWQAVAAALLDAPHRTPRP